MLQKTISKDRSSALPSVAGSDGPDHSCIEEDSCHKDPPFAIWKILADLKIAGENAFSQDENFVFIFCSISNSYVYRE